MSSHRRLELDPEELDAELARYTNSGEVDQVRASIDSGEFRLSWLDDLVHHRRARFHDQDDVDAA